MKKTGVALVLFLLMFIFVGELSARTLDWEPDLRYSNFHAETPGVWYSGSYFSSRYISDDSDTLKLAEDITGRMVARQFLGGTVQGLAMGTILGLGGFVIGTGLPCESFECLVLPVYTMAIGAGIGIYTGAIMGVQRVGRRYHIHGSTLHTIAASLGVGLAASLVWGALHEAGLELPAAGLVFIAAPVAGAILGYNSSHKSKMRNQTALLGVNASALSLSAPLITLERPVYAASPFYLMKLAEIRF